MIHQYLHIYTILIIKYRHRHDVDDSSIRRHLPLLSIFQTSMDACVDFSASDVLLTETRDAQKWLLKLFLKKMIQEEK